MSNPVTDITFNDYAAIADRVATLDNPLWKYLQENVPHDDVFDFQRTGEYVPSPWGDIRKVRKGGKLHRYRDYVTTQWSWAITSPESLAYVAGILNARPVVEMGAGAGYWAWMLTQIGIDVHAYDKAPVGHDGSWFGEKRIEALGERYADLGIVEQEYHPVMLGGPEVLDDEDPNRVLLLIWPPYGSPFAADCLKHFKGDTLIFIGEGSGGCTGDDEFFKMLGEEYCYCNDGEKQSGECEHGQIKPTWAEVNDGPMTQWGGIHDLIWVYKRIVSLTD